MLICTGRLAQFPGHDERLIRESPHTQITNEVKRALFLGNSPLMSDITGDVHTNTLALPHLRRCVSVAGGVLPVR